MGPASFVVSRRMAPTRETLAILEHELFDDPFALDILYAAALQHLALGEADQAEEMLQTFVILAPRSDLAQAVARR